MLYTFPPEPGAASPWGAVQTVEPLGPAVVIVTTASHGGFRLSPAALHRLPVVMRETAYSGGGWFEEDCDWALPYLALSLDDYERDGEAGARRRAAAIATVQRYHPQHAVLLGLVAPAGGQADG
jgi:hypothetical protein